MIIDECHGLARSYVRDAISSVRHILGSKPHNVQVVPLSATAPARILKEVCGIIRVPYSSFIILRSPVGRENLAIEVQHVEKGERESVLHCVKAYVPIP